VWLLFNNYYALDVYFFEIVLFGLFVCSLVYLFIIKFTPISFKRDIKLCKKAGWILLYFLVLVKEVVISNFKVLLVILNPKDKPSPEIVSFDIDVKTRLIRTLVANSITLTPGTISISLQRDKIIVHCLKKEFIEGFEDSQLVRIAEKIEEGGL
jgi:multicomponent Na+:H+ antiporter subunit E